MDRIFGGGLRSMVNECGMGVRVCVIVLVTVMIWLFVWTVHGENVTTEARLTSEEGRFRTLMILGVEYENMVQSKSGINGEADVAGVFAEVSEGMQLGSRVQRITPEGLRLQFFFVGRVVHRCCYNVDKLVDGKFAVAYKLLIFG